MPTCEWCDEPFERSAARGPVPRFCSNAHRQAAHRRRHAERLAVSRGASRQTADGSGGAARQSAAHAALVLRHRPRILEIAAEHGATNVRLFGSVARGDETPSSDVDLLVDLEPGVGLVTLCGLERRVAELLGCDVDVVPSSGLKPQLIDEVMSEAIAL